MRQASGSCAKFILGVTLWLVAASAASAAIDLELRQPSQIVIVGQTVQIGLYAVSDNLSNQSLSTVDLVFSWDPSYLQLISLNQTGADANVLSAFFPAGDMWGLNEAVPPQDGTGLQLTWAMFGSPVQATPAGTLLTTFQFQALTETPLFSPTQMIINTSGGNGPGGPRETKVLSGEESNLPVTGQLGMAEVTIVPEPSIGIMAALALGGATVRRKRTG
jgi:hypothetical protein